MPLNNSQYQKNANVSLIAREIWRRGETSRTEVSSALGLYRSTVTNIISYLLEEGIVVEGNQLESGAAGGRKATTIKLNREFGIVIGIDIQPNYYRYVVLSFSGEQLENGFSLMEETSLEQQLVKATDEILSKVRKRNLPVIAISYSIPGMVDSKNGIVLFSMPLKQQKPFPLKEKMEERYGVQVILENDANCLCMLNYHLGKLDNRSIAMVIKGEDHSESKLMNVELGMGIGIGIMSGGKIFRGSHFAAGEFVSLSWDMVKNSQTGLDMKTLTTVEQNVESWKKWMNDTFLSLVPVIAIMDLNKIVIHPPTEERGKDVLKFLLEDLEPFRRVLERAGCVLEIGVSDKNKCALGAAYHYLETLFSVPEDHYEGECFSVEWKELASRIRCQTR